MELNTAMTVLQILAGLILIGVVARLFAIPKAWKQRNVREHSLDEYLDEQDRNGGRLR